MLNFLVPLAVDMSLHVDGACGAAMRRRQRRLRAQLRHEQQTVAMVLATVGHHSFGPTAYAAPRGQTTGTSAREGEVRELHHGLRAQERPLPGTRPAGLAEPRGDVVQVQRHVVGGAPSLPTLVVPVPQMVDQPVDILEIIAKLSPPVVEQVIDVPKIIQDSAPQRLKPPEPQQLVEQLVEVPLPASGYVGALAYDANGQVWSRIWDPTGQIYWWCLDTGHTQWRPPSGLTASPGRYINTGQG